MSKIRTLSQLTEPMTKNPKSFFLAQNQVIAKHIKTRLGFFDNSVQNYTFADETNWQYSTINYQ